MDVLDVEITEVGGAVAGGTGQPTKQVLDTIWSEAKRTLDKFEKCLELLRSSHDSELVQ